MLLSQAPDLLWLSSQGTIVAPYATPGLRSCHIDHPSKLRLKPCSGHFRLQKGKGGATSSLRATQKSAQTPSLPPLLFWIGAFVLLFSKCRFQLGVLLCSFVWVRRCSNSAPHTAARIALNSSVSFTFNKDNLPLLCRCL